MKKTKTFVFTIVVVIALGISASCNKKQEIKLDYIYTPPQEFADGLETASLESVGMNPTPIINMMNYLNSNNGHKIHNILIIKNNKLVFEQYFQGYKFDITASDMNGELMDYNRETDHFMASVSKSVTSVIVGIAVKNGFINDLNAKIIDYFPEYTDILTADKANITIHHLLSMTCGLAFDESTYLYNDSRNELRQAMDSEDPVRFILSKPIVSIPGKQFHYSSGCGIVLASIIEKATGMKFLDYANENLFDPLRSEGGSWTACSSGLIFASGGLYFKARELCKIGLLFLNNGFWEGNQIITPDWITISQERHVSSTINFFPNSGYGYQWWLTEFPVNGITQKCFFAAGWGDQYMFIIPGLDMIIEFNSGNYEGNSNISPFNLINDYILKSIE